MSDAKPLLKELENIYRQVPLLTRYSSLVDVYKGMKDINGLKMHIFSHKLFEPIFEGEVVNYFKEGLKEAKKKMKYDGTHWRLCKHYAGEEKEVFVVQPVKYSMFLATNRNKDVVNNSKDLFNPFIYDDLANSIGSVSAIVLEGKGKFYTIIGERSKELAIYPELYGTPAGMCSYGLEFHNNLLKEIKEEIKMEFEVRKIKGTYLGRSADDLHPETLFLIYGTLKNPESNEIKANWEYKIKNVKLVEIGSEEHMHYLAQLIDDIPQGVVKRKNIEKYWQINKTPRWVPAQWIASALTIVYKYFLNSFS